MQYYNKKTLKKPQNFYTFKNFSIQKECTKFSRCNDFRTCKTCNYIHTQKMKKQLLGHLTEEVINSYKYKYFIRVRNDDKNINIVEKNQMVNFFINDFTSSKRNKNFIIDKNSQYIINKEVSYSKEYGYNPHYHIILLTNKEFDLNNTQLKKMMIKNNIDLHITNIYKKNNSYLESIKNIFTYINKYDESTAKIQRENKLLKGEHSNKSTNLFNSIYLQEFKKDIYSKFYFLISFHFLFKFEELHQNLYIKIMEDRNKKIKLAKQIFKRNINKKHSKNYIRLHKSLMKKLKFINLQFKRRITALVGGRLKKLIT